MAQKGLGTPIFLNERGAKSKKRENETSEIINNMKRSKVHISSCLLLTNLIFKITKKTFILDVKMSYKDLGSFFNEKERCNMTQNYAATRITNDEQVKMMHAKSSDVE